jgi:predicted dehydrogenase
MQFALLGNHPDGIDVTRALTATGRYHLRAYSGPALGRAQLQRLGLEPRNVSDLEEILADSAIELVIVAGSLGVRSAQLKRALQSECHVACVHPANPSPDIAYEAALIQGDTRRVLLPLAPTAMHPGVKRLAELAKDWLPLPGSTSLSARVLELEIWSTEEVLLELTEENPKPSIPGWDIARCVGGEIADVFAQTTRGELEDGEPILLAGRFVNGMLLQAMYLSNQAEGRWRLSLVTTTGRATLLFAHGWPGPATLTYTDERGEARSESWQMADPWLGWIERFEQELAHPTDGVAEESLAKTPPVLGWQDELRALELDDAVRRSVQYGRSSALDLQEVTEEASFKGTMTLVGCSMIWFTVVILIVSVWVPWITWLIVPLFAVFLILQGFRWVFPKKETGESIPSRARNAVE